MAKGSTLLFGRVVDSMVYEQLSNNKNTKNKRLGTEELRI